MKFVKNSELSNYRLEITDEKGSTISNGVDVGTQGGEKIYSLSNLNDGVYTAVITAESNGDKVELDRKEFGVNCFTDIKNHWARNTIIDLFKEGYVKGAGDDKFKPDNSLTRAEFMTLIARALNIQSPTNGFVSKFSDLKNNHHWASLAITALEEKGYINGFKNSKGIWYIAPNSQITRAEMAAILSRILVVQGIINESGTMSTAFPDVEGHWAENNIKSLEKLNLIEGNENGLFKPDAKTTRAEAAVIIQRYNIMVQKH